MCFTPSRMPSARRGPMWGSAKSARRSLERFLALLAPSWVRDSEISLAEEEAVCGLIYFAASPRAG
jgi:hypothetical protein